MLLGPFRTQGTATQGSGYGNGMPHPADPHPELLDAMERELARRRQRLARRGMAPARADAAECRGALWLELADGARAPAAAARRVAYREWEAVRAAAGLEAEPAAPAEAPPGALLPPSLQAWAEELLDCGPLPGRLGRSARHLCLTRAQLRMRATAVWRALSGDPGFHDLRCRVARVCARGASEGRTRAVCAEARRLRSLLAVLEVPEDLQRAVATLRTLAP